MTTNNDKLDDFYAALREGMKVEEFLRRHEAIFPLVHSHCLTKEYRVGRGSTKVLSDEVTPVARFCRLHAASEDGIRFESFENGSEFPDCVITYQDGHKRGVEVTVADARKRLHKMTELNETGWGRGHINVREDAPQEEFEHAMAQEHRAHSTDEIINCLLHDIGLRAEKKKLHQGDTLLIEADLLVLPAERWQDFREKLAEKVNSLNFGEVYLTGHGDAGDICMKIS